jgi:hypothetical protein
MTAFLNNFSNVIIDRIVEDVSANTTNYYVFAGRYYDWDDNNAPPLTTLSVQAADFDVRRDILFGKRITSGDIAKLIRKNQWSSNTVYDYYDHREPDLLASDFFVLNSANNVYKCLFNNDGEPSTAEPSYIGTNTVETADGYIWKYMYSMEGSAATKFANETMIPITANTVVQNAAVGGTIEVVIVDDGGSGYQVYNTGTIQTVVSNTVFRVADTASSINNIYTTGAIYIDTGTGAGSISEITQYTSNSSGKFVTVANTLSLDLTSTYVISPRVLIDGDGTGVVAYSTVNTLSEKVDRIFVQNVGSNYTLANVSIIANTVHGTGAAATAIISPIRGHGFDPANELGATDFVVAVDFDGTEANTIPSSIQFGQAGIIRAVEKFANTDLYTNTTFNHTVSFDTAYVAGVSFSQDETIVGLVSGATAKVINSDMDVCKVFMISNTVFTNGESVLSSNTGIQATITNVTARDINKLSGEILYYTNFSPFTRQAISTETVKLIIRV